MITFNKEREPGKRFLLETSDLQSSIDSVVEIVARTARILMRLDKIEEKEKINERSGI